MLQAQVSSAVARSSTGHLGACECVPGSWQEKKTSLATENIPNWPATMAWYTPLPAPMSDNSELWCSFF
jgi:hypothetical protein